MINFATLLVIAYGLFTLMGGIIGFVKAKSVASLIAGFFSGVALLVSAVGMTQGIGLSYIVILVVALFLGIRFLGTWLKNRRLMPDLLMVIFSFLTFIVVGLRMVQS